VRLAISSRSHSANSSCIASPKRLPVSSRAMSVTPSSPRSWSHRSLYSLDRNSLLRFLASTTSMAPLSASSITRLKPGRCGSPPL
jgi:hypothetical protein